MIKEIVDQVGLFQPQELWNLSLQLKIKLFTTFQSNNSLIVVLMQNMAVKDAKAPSQIGL